MKATETKQEAPELVVSLDHQHLVECTDEARKQLLESKNIVGIGYGRKQTGGRLTNDYSIIFFVREKLSPEAVKARKLTPVPPAIDGIPTDVVVPGSRPDPAHNVADAAFIDFAKLQKEQMEDLGEVAIHAAGGVDLDNIAVIEDNGAIVQPNGTINYATAYAKFRETHPDIYDFVTFFSDFPPPFNYSFWSGIYNATQGIGLGSFNSRAAWGTNQLQGFHFIHPGHWNSMFAMLQETGHQWGAFVFYKDTATDPVNHTDLLLGGTPGHWDRYFDDEHSPMDYDGIDWVDNLNGTFTSHPSEENMYCDLDLYLMGLLPPAEVRPFWFIRSPTLVSGTTYSGVRKNLTAQNIIWAMGQRNPDSTRAQRQYKEAWILVTRNINTVQTAAATLEARRRQYAETFFRAARYRARIDTTLAPVNAKIATGTINLSGPAGQIIWSAPISHGLGRIPVLVKIGYETSLGGSPIDSYPEQKSPDIAGGISHLEAQVTKPYDGTFKIVAQDKQNSFNLTFRWWAMGEAF